MPNMLAARQRDHWQLPYDLCITLHFLVLFENCCNDSFVRVLGKCVLLCCGETTRLVFNSALTHLMFLSIHHLAQIRGSMGGSECCRTLWREAAKSPVCSALSSHFIRVVFSKFKVAVYKVWSQNLERLRVLSACPERCAA